MGTHKTTAKHERASRAREKKWDEHLGGETELWGTGPSGPGPAGQHLEWAEPASSLSPAPASRLDPPSRGRPRTQHPAQKGRTATAHPGQRSPLSFRRGLRGYIKRRSPGASSSLGGVQDLPHGSLSSAGRGPQSTAGDTRDRTRV